MGHDDTHGGIERPGSGWRLPGLCWRGDPCSCVQGSRQRSFLPRYPPPGTPAARDSRPSDRNAGTSWFSIVTVSSLWVASGRVPSLTRKWTRSVVSPRMMEHPSHQRIPRGATSADTIDTLIGTQPDRQAGTVYPNTAGYRPAQLAVDRHHQLHRRPSAPGAPARPGCRRAPRAARGLARHRGVRPGRRQHLRPPGARGESGRDPDAGHPARRLLERGAVPPDARE